MYLKYKSKIYPLPKLDIIKKLSKKRNIIEEIQQKVNAINGIQSGIVRIGTFSSVAINWLPDVFAKFQEDYPWIDYEMLLGDYDEVEKWISEGRVDCGFLLNLPLTITFR